MDSFAKKQLEKFGWVNGKGLGKSENGIVEALKPPLKSNSFGVGYDLGEEYKFHWWDHVFNSAAQNIEVDNSKDSVEFKHSKKKILKIDTKKPNQLKDNDLCYGTFVKSEVLTAEGIEHCQIKKNNQDQLSLQSSNDEDLLNICGGRTAHKAARHGHAMSGKMLRIEEQERLFIETAKLKNKSDNGTADSSSCSDLNESSLEKRKKKRKRKMEETS